MSKLPLLLLLLLACLRAQQLPPTCLQPCLTCAPSNSTTCLTCILGFTLQGNYCLPFNCQVLYCNTCSSPNTCLQCQPNFLLANNSCYCQTTFAPSLLGSPAASCVCTQLGCVSCKLDGCLTCSSQTSCSACLPTYSLNGMGGCISCNIANCLTCQVNNFCLTCANNLTVSQSGQCVSCNASLPGCTVCSDNGRCSCPAGYSYLFSNNASSCYLCTVPACSSCANAQNVCSSCNFGYSLSANNTCLPNPPSTCNYPCATCNLNGSCSTCFYTYSSQPAANGSCFACSTPYCLTCLPSNTSQCTACNNRYLLVNGSCQLNFIPNCQNANNNTCLNCASGFTLQSGNCLSCAAAGPACTACQLVNSTTICTLCANGNVLVSGQCVLCPSYCGATCTPSGTCLGYNLNSILIVNQFYIEDCPSGCSSCASDNPAYCTQCSSGYYLLSGNCLPCAPASNCLYCTAVNPAQCLSCASYNWLNAINGTFVCQTCVFPCLQCLPSSLTTCTGCPTNYYLVNGSCVPNNCGPNCAICASPTSCALCMPSYFPLYGDGLCYPGSAGCYFALLTNPTLCEACYIGMGYNYYTSTCIQCPTNCQTCAAPNTCTYCADGYYLTNTAAQVCAPNCVPPCATCSYSNPTSCLSCIAGYLFASNTNKCITNTLSCSSNVYSCAVCPLGASFNNPQQCVTCAIGCQTCLGNSTTTCTSCPLGNWLNGTKCPSCMAGCAQCISAAICQQCAIGFVSNSWGPMTGMAQTTACLACQSPCVSCFMAPTYCMSCVNGYVLIGGQCLNSYNNIFSLTVSANSSTFYAQYPQLVAALLIAANSSNQGLLFPTGILPSPASFLFSAKINSQCTPNSSCSASEFSRLQQVLTAPSIAGMTILSSTLNPSNGQAFPPCASPCSTCTAPNGTVCLSCLQGFVLRNSSCLSATCTIMYCQFCSNAFTCVQCQPTFLLANNSCLCQTNYAPSLVGSNNAACVCPAPGSNFPPANCFLCQVSNCLACSNASSCSSCLPGYAVTPSGGCLQCSIPSCSACSTNNFCSACQNGLSISTSGTCVICQNTGCALCSSGNVCSQCANGFQAVTAQSGVSCVSCGIANCGTCTDNNVCGNCIKGFQLNLNNTCSASPCLLPCTSCFANGSCLQCLSPLYSLLSNNGVCFACTTANCLICSTTNTSVCMQCLSGYNLISNSPTAPPSFCSQTSSGCAAYTSSNFCLYCLPYYALDVNNGFCIRCTNTQQACTNCLSTNPSICSGCQNGFYLNAGSCYACPAFCLSCNSTACFQPAPNAVMISNTVYLEACQWPCASCAPANPAFCLVCQGGFYYASGSCLPCTPSSNCLSCLPASPTFCTSCFSYGVMAANQTCVSCAYPCLTCSNSPTSCTTCVQSYSLNSNNSCVLNNCSAFCASCTPTGCATCTAGYFLYNGVSCQPGVPGCIAAFSNNPGNCLQCAAGLVLNFQVCLQCPANCYECSFSLVCMSCNAGYYLTGNSAVPCAPSCLFPCATCSYTQPALCFSCLAGYLYNTNAPNQCQPISNCAPSCVVCPRSFVLTTAQQCVACSTSCASCQPNATAVCTSCLPGMYLNGTSCATCPANCSLCTGTSNCLACASGFLPMTVSFSMTAPQTVSCVSCQYPCSQCLYYPNYCVGCASGFSLMGTQCLSNYRYKLNLTFANNFSVFFQNYATLTASLLQPLNATNNLGLGALFPNGVQFGPSGSTIYGVFLSSQCQPQTACSQDEYNRISSMLSMSTLANMSMPTATLLTYGGNPQVPNGTVTCQSPCATCSATFGTCLSCLAGYSLANGQCVNASCLVSNCQQCANNTSTVCSTCNPSFILSNSSCVCQVGWTVVNGSCQCNPTAPSSKLVGAAAAPIPVDFCVLCRVSNCLSCVSSSNCSVCAVPYSATPSGACVNCNINNCLVCSANNFCASCGGGLNVSSSGDRCLICTTANCFACSTPNVCAACQPGFAFDSQNVSCVNCSLPNCLICQGNNLCSSCAAGYILSNFTCVVSNCSYPCASCANDGGCNVCVSPPFVTSPGPNGCFSCNVANCLNCAYNATSVCLSCMGGFSLSSNSTLCQPTCAITSCTACSNSTYCTTCTSSFIAVNGSCQACPNGCTSCSPNNTCQTCLSGFYILNGFCLACPSYCSQCSSASQCDQLAATSGYSLVDVNGQSVLAVCDQGCLECSQTAPSVCLSCSNGYYLLNSICQPCDATSNCQTCSPTAPGQCLTCFPNSYLTNNVCSSCVFPCLTCQATNVSLCNSCPNGYLLANTQCQPVCPAYCTSCSSSTLCLQCINGFVALSGSCVPCLTGCATCSAQSPGLCLSCNQGTYLDTGSNTCLACSSYCLSCQANGCSSCLSGYYLTGNLTCAPNCLPPCATCSTVDPSSCLSCQLGYTFDSSSLQNCRANTNCSSNSTCVGCPLGFTFLNLQCIACSSSCARCLSNSTFSCTSCYSGQYLNAYTCFKCAVGCSSCLSNSSCLSCSNGYTAVSASSNAPTTCVACQSPCSRCFNSPTTCAACVGGYSMVDSKCQSNFRFAFSVTLNTDSANFYQNYLTFIKTLAGNVNLASQYATVSIASIGAGSVLVNGAVSTNSAPQTAASQQEYASIQQSLASNGNVAGMPVLKSTVSAQGGNPEVPISNTLSTASWIVIVAVIVPLVLAIGIGVGLFIFCRRRRRMASSSLQVTLATTPVQIYELQATKF